MSAANHPKAENNATASKLVKLLSWLSSEKHTGNIIAITFKVMFLPVGYVISIGDDSSHLVIQWSKTILSSPTYHI